MLCNYSRRFSPLARQGGHRGPSQLVAGWPPALPTRLANSNHIDSIYSHIIHKFARHLHEIHGIIELLLSHIMSETRPACRRSRLWNAIVFVFGVCRVEGRRYPDRLNSYSTTNSYRLQAVPSEH